MREWCRDPYGPYALGGEVGTGQRIEGLDPKIRAVCGGAYISSGEQCRVTKRTWEAPDLRSSTIGLRPARRIVAP